MTRQMNFKPKADQTQAKAYFGTFAFLPTRKPKANKNTNLPKFSILNKSMGLAPSFVFLEGINNLKTYIYEMKKIITLLILLLITPYLGAQTANIVYQKTINSVVTIETDIGLGSGFFITNNLVATNYHVIEGATNAIIILNSTSQTFKVEGYVAKDENNDLAILKVSYLKGVPLKFATKNVKQGDDILVIGSPKGIPATISKGIVSNLNSVIKLIQIDASISHGSSGGPVLNMNGEVIGVAVGAIENGQNLNFAIPIRLLENLLDFKTSFATKLNSKDYSAASNNNETLESNSRNSPNLNQTNIVKDIDGNAYKTVKIGSQTWMAENLKTTKYSDGNTISLVTYDDFWSKLTSPAFCWYSNDTRNIKLFGALYNWYTVDKKKLCPNGWHVPSDYEWLVLIDYLGGFEIAGGKLKETGTLHWRSPNNGANDELGFTVLPGGDRFNGNFNHIGNYATFWSSSADSEKFANAQFLSFDNSKILLNSYYKSNGFSVRCIKD